MREIAPVPGDTDRAGRGWVAAHCKAGDERLASGPTRRREQAVLHVESNPPRTGWSGRGMAVVEPDEGGPSPPVAPTRGRPPMRPVPWPAPPGAGRCCAGISARLCGYEASPGANLSPMGAWVRSGPIWPDASGVPHSYVRVDRPAVTPALPLRPPSLPWEGVGRPRSAAEPVPASGLRSASSEHGSGFDPENEAISGAGVGPDRSHSGCERNPIGRGPRSMRAGGARAISQRGNRFGRRLRPSCEGSRGNEAIWLGRRTHLRLPNEANAAAEQSHGRINRLDTDLSTRRPLCPGPCPLHGAGSGPEDGGPHLEHRSVVGPEGNPSGVLGGFPGGASGIHQAGRREDGP